MTATEIINGKSVAELSELRQAIDVQLTGLRATEASRLLEEFKRDLAGLGMTLEELIRSEKKSTRKPRQPKNAEAQ